MSINPNFASFAQESSRVTFQEDEEGGANFNNDQAKQQKLLLAESSSFPIINVTLRNHSQDSLKMTNYGPENYKDADPASEVKADSGAFKLGMSRNIKNNSANSKISYKFLHSKQRTDTGLAQAYLSPGKLRSEPRNRSQGSSNIPIRSPRNNTSLKKVQSEIDRHQRLTNKMMSRKFRVSMPEEQLEAMQSQSDDEDS